MLNSNHGFWRHSPTARTSLSASQWLQARLLPNQEHRRLRRSSQCMWNHSRTQRHQHPFQIIGHPERHQHTIKFPVVIASCTQSTCHLGWSLKLPRPSERLQLAKACGYVTWPRFNTALQIAAKPSFMFMKAGSTEPLAPTVSCTPKRHPSLNRSPNTQTHDRHFSR